MNKMEKIENYEERREPIEIDEPTIKNKIMDKVYERAVSRKIYLDIIVDKLYEGLTPKHNNKEIEISSYKLDDGDLTYLLEKYDPNRFKKYKEMLLKDSEADE